MAMGRLKSSMKVWVMRMLARALSAGMAGSGRGAAARSALLRETMAVEAETFRKLRRFIGENPSSRECCADPSRTHDIAAETDSTNKRTTVLSNPHRTIKFMDCAGACWNSGRACTVRPGEEIRNWKGGGGG